MKLSVNEVGLRYALSNYPKIGPIRFKQVLQKYPNLENYFDGEKLVLSEFPIIKINKSILDDSFGEISKLADKGVEIIVYGDSGYPEYLAKITDSPPVLFAVGDTQLLQNKRMISIVGTRNMTDYGRTVIKDIVRGLVKNNFVVVSGMAFGVDREVHIQTMVNKGKTIAVLPTSPLYPIPKMNSDIYKNISEQGLVISESLMNGEVPSGSFPRRNRIIAGLSLGTIIIEASKSSGSLITANLAFNEGRQVFAVPGRVDQKYSIGCNSIIRDLKAKLIESVEDILIEFGINDGQKCNQGNIYKDLMKEERDVIDTIISGQNTVDQLVNSLGIEVKKLTTLLGKLEILGYIVRKIDGTISTA